MGKFVRGPPSRGRIRTHSVKRPLSRAQYRHGFVAMSPHRNSIAEARELGWPKGAGKLVSGLKLSSRNKGKEARRCSWRLLLPPGNSLPKLAGQAMQVSNDLATGSLTYSDEPEGIGSSSVLSTLTAAAVAPFLEGVTGAGGAVERCIWSPIVSSLMGAQLQSRVSASDRIWKNTELPKLHADLVLIKPFCVKRKVVRTFGFLGRSLEQKREISYLVLCGRSPSSATGCRSVNM